MPPAETQPPNAPPGRKALNYWPAVPVSLATRHTRTVINHLSHTMNTCRRNSHPRFNNGGGRRDNHGGRNMQMDVCNTHYAPAVFAACTPSCEWRRISRFCRVHTQLRGGVWHHIAGWASTFSYANVCARHECCSTVDLATDLPCWGLHQEDQEDTDRGDREGQVLTRLPFCSSSKVLPCASSGLRLV